MLTSPKVRDPFQVVRMSSSVGSGTPHSARVSPFLHPIPAIGSHRSPRGVGIHIRPADK
jgi:hypothetical protein